jgi:hypothetical protein
VQISDPPAKYGDYNPAIILPAQKLIWLRGTSITDKSRNVWISEKDGSNALEWIKGAEEVAVYGE